MHELPLISQVVTDALTRMRAAGGVGVTRVEVLVGSAGHLEPEAVEQHFHILAAGTPAEDAAVRVTMVPAKVRCFDCLHQFETVLHPYEVSCPRCGGHVLPGALEDFCQVGEVEVRFDAGSQPCA